MLAKVWSVLKRVHRSEQGAEGLEKLLILAAVVLPLLGVLIYFRKEIGGWTSDQLDLIRDQSDIRTDSPTG